MAQEIGAYGAAMDLVVLLETEYDRVSSRPRRSIIRAPNIGYATRGAATSTSAARMTTALLGAP